MSALSVFRVWECPSVMWECGVRCEKPSLTAPTPQVDTANELGLTVLMVACLREDVSVVRMLIEAGAGIDVRNPGQSS